MSLKGKTTFVACANKHYVNVPIHVYLDSAFPFRKGDKLEIEIEKNTLRIRRMPDI